MSANLIPVFVACNRFYLPHAYALASSIAEYTEHPVRFHILKGTDISLAEERQFTLLFEGISNIEIQFIDVQKAGYDFKNANPRSWSKEAFYRFTIPLMFPHYERCLYFDCDVLVFTDLWKMLNYDLKGNILGGCIDHGFKILFAENQIMMGDKSFQEYYTQTVKINLEDYISSGVLIFDLKQIREQELERFKQFTIQKIEYYFPDQDLINYEFKNRIEILNEQWGKGELEILNELPLGRVVHFAGYNKPWFHSDSPVSCFYWNLLRNSPYYYEAKAQGCIYTIEKAINKATRPTNDSLLSALIHFSFAVTKCIYERFRKWIKK